MYFIERGRVAYWLFINYASILHIGLAVNTGKTKYTKIGRHRGMIANTHIKIDSNSYEKVKILNT